ncbi:MAG TPA: precorrin-4 C(11)-methyltransferase [Solirubrobacterales bacterium]|jgi:precorrin-4/cobalt-precorrin-4 C11-methyltransferase
MSVHFIGAGPGAADLLTLRGRDLIASSPVCLYAGALVPPEILTHAPRDARLVDTQDLTLEQIVAEFARAHDAGHEVARLHSGDLSIYSAAAEQMRRLDALGIPWDVTPGVPAFAATAAAIGRELTIPEVAQTVILTRYGRRASAMPPGERLADLASHGATLVVHLGAQAIEEIVETLIPSYGPECPVAVVARASRPDEVVLRASLAEIAEQVRSAGVVRTATIVVGPALAAEGFRDSHLYSAGRERPAPATGGICSSSATRPRADGCPGILRLHPAEDGGLARVRLSAGRLSLLGLRALGEAAAIGNGVVELTSRGNLQVRGVPNEAEASLADALRAGGLLPAAEHERVRNVAASSLAGRLPSSLAPTDEIAALLDQRLCDNPELVALSGRFLFALDDGSATVGIGGADVALTAERTGGFRLRLAGQATDRIADAADAAALAVAAARAFLAAAREADRADAWRIADLPDGAELVAGRLGASLVESATPTPAKVPLGRVEQADGRWAVTVLPPLGRLDPAMLDAVAAPGHDDVRVSGRRTLSFVDLTAPEVEPLLGALEEAGFAVSEESGWWGLSACAGLGACARAVRDVRAMAARRAAQRRPGDPPEHWSACDRGCGRPSGAREMAT